MAKVKQWAPDGDDVRGFWVCPPAAEGDTLDVKVLPPAAGYEVAVMDAEMGIPDWLMTPLVAFVVARAESKDDENVNSGRAAMMTTQFADAIKAGQGA